MPLTPKERAARARDRMIQTAKQYQTSTYARKVVAIVFQKMIRAEWAATKWQFAYAIIQGSLECVVRPIGCCVCVTCGRIDRWNGRQMHTGHFLPSRRNSILLVEDNVAPQCAHCNRHLGGNPIPYRQWMIEMRGEETVERLERLKTESVSFGHEQLVDMKIEYEARLKTALEAMK